MSLKKKLNNLLAGSVQRVLDASYAVYLSQVGNVPQAFILSAEEFGSLVAEKLRKGEK